MVDNIKDVLVSVAKTSTVKQARITSVAGNGSSGSEDVGVEVSHVSGLLLSSFPTRLRDSGYI